LKGYVIGIDDAGRGCVIGPLVIAGVTIDIDLMKELGAIGVKDSKKLSPDNRERLYDLLISNGIKHEVVKISPRRIDAYVRRRKKHEKLNKLEAMNMAEVINRLEGDTAIIDACDNNLAVFCRQIATRLKRNVRLIVTHKADLLYPVVSAASIVAKVERDREIAMLRRKYGDFGSGYPSDRKTIDFLENWFKEYCSFPPIVRMAWKTIKKLKSRSS
jgi:ribonuclease HII